MRRCIHIFLAMVLCVASQAATYCVRPTSNGNGSGSDWNNALGASFTPSRGNTYYFADGAYGYRTYSVANSGTSTITFKKALESDHVTSTGWSTADGDGQAEWDGMLISTDYWIINGQWRSSTTEWDGAIATYGFRSANIRLDDASSVNCDNSTFSYIDIHGGGRDTGDGDDAIYSLYGMQNVTFSHCCLRDTDRTIFLLRGGTDGLVVEYCWLGRNASSPAIHGEIMSITSGDNCIWRYNKIEDPEGTAVWAFLNNGTADGWEFYGNVIYHSSSYAREGIAGVIYCAYDGSQHNTLSNAKFYNNTIYNITGAYSGVHIENGTGNTAVNCIWVNCADTGHAGVTGSYNYYYNTTGSDGGTGTQAGSTGNIFVNTSTENFHLSGSNLPNAGTTLTGYSTDMDGNTRGSDGTWDRGAFEYVSGSDTTAPTATITSPTSSSTYSTSSASLSIGGSASDNVGVSSVTASMSGATSGSITITGTTSWSGSTTLNEGDTTITVTATDAASNTGTDTITVTYIASQASSGGKSLRHGTIRNGRF